MKKTKSVIERLTMKDGRTPEELSRAELWEAMTNHALPGLPDYNLSGATLPALAKASSVVIQEQKDQLTHARVNGVEGNSGRAAEFYSQVRAHVAISRAPKATLICEEVMLLIGMDTALIQQAKARGESWEGLDLKFSRKNENGDPYAKGYVLTKIREIRKATEA